MELGFQSWLPDFSGLQSMLPFGAQRAQNLGDDGFSIECAHLLAPKPKGFEKVPLAMVQSNLAVAPTDWIKTGVSRPWFVVEGKTSFTNCMAQFSNKPFIAFDDDFLGFVGRNAQLDMIHKFSGKDAQHVHEAPAYVYTTNELVFADTSVIGWLWALEIDTHQIRKVNTNPPLANVNGATMRDSRLYLATNGGNTPAVWNCSVPQGLPKVKDSSQASTKSKAKAKTKAKTPEDETIACLPVVNNYRLNHLNSPNDLIFTSNGNILFTDPLYGWLQSWPGVGPPELPTATYLLNTKTRALVPLDDQLLQPNGLALSADEKTLYIADSNSTSGKPPTVWRDSVRNVYAFDFDEASLALKNKRLVHMGDSGWPDGVRVTKFRGKSRSGKDRELLLVAIMGGVDVIDVSKGGAGVLIGKINVGDDIIFNLEPAMRKQGSYQGKQIQRNTAASTWLMTGKKGIYKVSVP